MTPDALSPANLDDAELVARSLSGDRQAFGRIVARYQALVCGLAYSATGSRSHSEDLAQETFVTAWRTLRELHEPSRLRSWLCGIARNTINSTLRRLSRQPAHDANALESAAELPSADALPTAQAVTNEEMALLWREIGRMPETYREPLILFYREHKSVERVAEALELSPDAVTQRLTRGRRILQERMLAFIESTLERSNPGPQFTIQVEAALPFLVGSGPALAIGSAAVKGSAAAKGTLLGTLLASAAPFVGVFAAIGISWADIAQARTARERRFIGWCTLGLWASTLAFLVALPIVARLTYRAGLYDRQDWSTTAPLVAVWFGIAMIDIALVVLLIRGKAAIRRLPPAGGSPDSPPPPPTLRKAVLLTVGFLTSVFWALIFIAWQTGDRAVALGITGLVVGLAVAPLWFGSKHPDYFDDAKRGSWYVSGCCLVFLAILNWRLDVWLAPIYHVDLATMHRLLPMPLIHALSLIAIGWAALLVRLTRPKAAA